MHASKTVTVSGTETVACPDVYQTMTGGDGNGSTTIPNVVPTATYEASCYPTYTVGYPDPSKEELVKICAMGQSDWTTICRGAGWSDAATVDCPGRRDPNNQHGPIWDNNYFRWFVKADNAPAECGDVFGNVDVNDSAKMLNVANLCVAAFEAITGKCNMNGGEVTNACGTFKYESCGTVSDDSCTPGHPARPNSYSQ